MNGSAAEQDDARDTARASFELAGIGQVWRDFIAFMSCVSFPGCRCHISKVPINFGENSMSGSDLSCENGLQLHGPAWPVWRRRLHTVSDESGSGSLMSCRP